MIFGWGRKRPKVREAAPSRKNIEMSAIPQAISDLEQLRSSTLVDEAGELRSKMVPGLNHLLGIADALERADLKTDDVDRHLKIMVVRGKKQTISVIRAEAGRATTDIRSASDVRVFAGEIGQSIKRIGDTLGRQSRVIHIFAKKHGNKLKDTLSILNSDRDELFKMVKSFDEFQNSIADLRLLLKQIADSEAAVSEKEEKTGALHETMVRITGESEAADRSIGRITSSHEYARYAQTREELVQTRQKEDTIRKEIESQFTKISRPLSKYFYVSSLDRDQMALLEQLVSKPADAVQAGSKSEIIMVLMAVRKGVLAGSVSVKDQMKSVSQIDDIVEMLDAFRGRFADHAAECKKLEDALKDFDASELDRLRTELEKARVDMDDCELRVRSIRSEIHEMAEQRAGMISKVETLLYDASSTRYSIYRADP